jgi:hypothetical protein
MSQTACATAATPPDAEATENPTPVPHRRSRPSESNNHPQAPSTPGPILPTQSPVSANSSDTETPSPSPTASDTWGQSFPGILSSSNTGKLLPVTIAPQLAALASSRGRDWRTSRNAIATLLLLRFTAKRNTNRSI